MSVALSIQLALYRQQQARIDALVGRPSKQFRQYELEYRRHSSRARRAMTRAQVNRRISASDVVYVGDYHSLSSAQRTFLELVEFQARFKRPLVLALECLDSAQQPHIDTFLQARHSTDWLARKLGRLDDGSSTLWKNFAPLLAWARDHRIEVVGIDSRASGGHSLRSRDRHAAQVISQVSEREERPLVMVLMGQYHVMPGHLPLQVREQLGKTTRRHLVVYQNAETLYWKLGRRGGLHGTEAVEIDRQSLCLVTGSPIAAQRSFLDFAQVLLGERVVEAEELQATFLHVARAIAREFGIDVKKPLKTLAVFTGATLDRLEKRLQQHRLGRSAVAAIRDHVLSQESAFLPSVNAVYLSSFSLSHVAEEAAHFVRHVAVGDAMTRPRPVADAFWARCLEEAIGFFGSKLVNPTRHTPAHHEWVEQFTDRTSQNRRVAAFVLALRGSPATQSTRLLPLGEPALFHQVSHALGYTLGNALFAQWQRGAFTRGQLRTVVSARFEDAATTWDELAELSGLLPRQRRIASSAPKKLTA